MSQEELFTLPDIPPPDPFWRRIIWIKESPASFESTFLRVIKAEKNGAVVFPGDSQPKVLVPREVMSVIDHGWEQKEEDNDSKHYSNRDGQHMPDVIELQHKNGMAGEAAAWAILTMGGIEDVTVPNIGHVPRTQRNHLPDMDLIDCKTVTRAKWKDGWVVQFDKTFPALKRQFHSLWIRVPVVLMVADWGSNAGQTVRMLGLCTWGFFRENMDAMQNDRYNSTKRALYPGNKLTGARDERFIPVSWWEDKTSEPDWDFFLDQQKIL